MPEGASYLLVFLAGLVVGRALGRRSSDAPRTPPLPPRPLPAEIDSRIRALLAERKKIEAIKLYRESMGVGLKEAKEAVETMNRP
jgi:hypothetical protein